MKQAVLSMRIIPSKSQALSWTMVGRGMRVVRELDEQPAPP